MIVLCLPRFVGKVALPVKTCHKHSADANGRGAVLTHSIRELVRTNNTLEAYHNMQRNYHDNLLHTLHLGGIQAPWRMNTMADP